MTAAVCGSGVAIRRDSPFRATIEADLSRAWALDYPTHPMADYVVTEIRPAS